MIKFLGIILFTVGLICALNDTWMNIEYQYGLENEINSLVVGVIVMAIIANIALPAIEWGNQAGKRSHILPLLIVWMMAGTFSFLASVERSGSSADAKITTIQNENKGLSNAQSKLKRAEAKLSKYRAVAAKEYVKVCDRNGKENRTQCPKYWTAKDEMGAAQTDKDVAEEKIENASAPIEVHSGGRRLAAILPVDETALSLYHPLLMPLTLPMGGYAFLWLASMMLKVESTPLEVVTVMDKKQALEWYRVETAKGNRPMNKELAQKAQVTPGTASKWLKADRLQHAY